jgi:Asp-tRNA(Asn)/Glu-tRNA(Gln) amidotransferase A subunit family amidase
MSIAESLSCGRLALSVWQPVMTRGLTDLTAAAAVAKMQNGEIKAEDYARALLDRAQRLERLNAFRVLDREAVLEAARAADKSRASGARLGLLHGLPVPVKNSVNTSALPTSNGTRALRQFMPKANAAVLVPLLAQGAIVMGKTNLHELSLGWTSNNFTFGAVHNPYDETRVPGGSSGGSAVAVAARMAPLAIAEDTLGSIRIPSTMCGLAGLRPTYGRYPDDGAQRQRIREAIRAHFAKHDIVALAFPPAMIAPPKIGDDGVDTIRGRTFPRTTTLGRNVSLGSCASLASLVLPAGMTSSGLPIGLEFDALPGEDRRLLAVGLSLERALGPVVAPRV